MKKLLLVLILLVQMAGCEVLIDSKNSSKDKKKEMAALYLFLRAQQGCSVSSITPISNSAITGSPFRTEYSIFGCSQESLGTIGLSGQNVTSGMTGTSTSSRIATVNDATSQTDMSIEVTFTLQSSSGYLEIMGLGSGTVGSFSGPAIRITTSGIQARGANSGTLSLIYLNPISVGQSKTYCIDFHPESPTHIAVWIQACSELTSAQRASYAGIEAGGGGPDIGTTQSGKKAGFLLNSASISSFKIGSRIGTAAGIRHW